MTILIGQHEISLGYPAYHYVTIPTPNTIYVPLVMTSPLVYMNNLIIHSIHGILLKFRVKGRVVATYTAESSSLMFRAGNSLQDTLTLSSQSHAVLSFLPAIPSVSR